jgi:phage terminase small subunit
MPARQQGSKTGEKGAGPRVAAKGKKKKTGKVGKRAAPARLNLRQERFVNEYLIDLNATEAAKRAGYAHRSAHTMGWDLLQKPEIAHAIRVAQEKRAQRTNITADRVLKELARIGFSDLRQVALWRPGSVELKASDELDDDAAAAVMEVSESIGPMGEKRKIKLHNKLGALKLIGQHLGMFEKQEEDTEAERGAINEFLSEVRKRRVGGG